MTNFNRVDDNALRFNEEVDEMKESYYEMFEEAEEATTMMELCAKGGRFDFSQIEL